MHLDEASIDLDHLAQLANLPLSEGERDALQNECQDVLDAFQIPESDDAPDENPRTPYVADEPDPTPREAADKLLHEAPRRDGRHIKA